MTCPITANALAVCMIRMIAFGVGYMRSGFLSVEDLRRHANYRISLFLKISVLFVCRGGYVSCWDMQNDN